MNIMGANRRQRNGGSRSKIPKVNLSILLLLALSFLSNKSDARKIMTVSAATAIAPSPIATAIPTETPAAKGSNPIKALSGYVWTSLVRFKDGSAQLYTNHKTCNVIRSKQKINLETIGRRGISFYEFNFLQGGLVDRKRLGNIVTMMFFAPNFVPYAFMFFPDMLPSPFAKGNMEQRTELERLAVGSRKKAHAVLGALLDIEREREDGTQSPLGKMNPFGKGKAEKEKVRMGEVFNLAVQCLTNKGPRIMLGNRNVIDEVASSREQSLLDALDHEIYTDEAPKRDQSQLVFVPKAIMRGLGGALPNGSALPSIVPHFLTRTKVITHINKLSEADSFLVEEDIDLDSITGTLLADTCGDRLIGSPLSSDQELRTKLGTWLECTTARPMSDILVEATPDKNTKALKRAGVIVTKGKDGTEKRYHNGNLARLAIMCFNAVDAVRDERCSSTLPRLLLQE